MRHQLGLFFGTQIDLEEQIMSRPIAKSIEKLELQLVKAQDRVVELQEHLQILKSHVAAQRK